MTQPREPGDPEELRKWMEACQCTCIGDKKLSAPIATTFHSEMQDEQADGWKQLLDLIEEAAADGREEFVPLHHMTLTARSQIVTLPPTIGKLKAVRNLQLYGSALVRIPPEIGEMENLRSFTPYMSYRLHWFPYEITRCAMLIDSCVSTRALYGNFKLRPPFPELEAPLPSTSGVDLDNLPARYGATRISICSVCRTSLAGKGLHQVWVSLNVGTDVLPLLVNACSAECVAELPPAEPGYVAGAHRGGLSVKQPPLLY